MKKIVKNHLQRILKMHFTRNQCRTFWLLPHSDRVILNRFEDATKIWTPLLIFSWTFWGLAGNLLKAEENDMVMMNGFLQNSWPTKGVKPCIQPGTPVKDSHHRESPTCCEHNLKPSIFIKWSCAVVLTNTTRRHKVQEGFSSLFVFCEVWTSSCLYGRLTYHSITWVKDISCTIRRIPSYLATKNIV